MSASPQVSVVIPAYNVRSYLAYALASLEKQSLQDFEAIIVNDGSTDDTPEIARAVCQRDSRFRLVDKPNGGLSSARNFGLRCAEAPYIALLDGDDGYHPDKLANHVARLDRDPTIGVVYSASRIIRDDGQPTWMTLDGQPILPDLLIAMLCKNFIGHGSNAILRRDVIDDVGEFDESLRSYEDADFWARTAATGRWKFYREPHALCNYRVRPSGLSFNVLQMQRSHERVIQKAYQRFPERVEPYLPTIYAYLYRFLARLSLTAGEPEQAQQFIQQAWESDRSIFFRDPRSLLTLIAVKGSPLANMAVKGILGSSQSK
ncbi:MAG: glycosyltransferase family 2 protein [Leptolyngbyaceae cyanobacterium bins.59]|nr:glycosyltransferase family 2 protein [Leptolyngbyaceae cyanobacterium bins.59]